MAVELATAYVSLSTSAKGLRKEVDRELGGAGESAGRKAGGKFTGAFKKVGIAGAAAVGGAVAAGFGTALVKGFGRLKAIEAAEAKLTGLGHSAETVEKIMSNATASVTGTAFGLGDAASAAASAVASGIKPGKDLERTLKLVGDASAIAGTDFNDMAAIFNKISAGGVIQGEELAQLGDRGIPILQLLGEEMGVTAQEVRKLASEGKVDFETFQSAIESGMGGAALESGKTFQGAMNNVGAALGRLGANLLGGVFPKIAPMLQGVIGWLDNLMPVAEKAGEAIGAAMSWAGNAIKGLFDLVVNGDFTGAFRKAFGLDEDSAIVGFLFTLRDTVINVFDEIKGGIAAFGAAWAYNDGEITSSGFPGVMERIGYAARQAFDYIRDVVIPNIQTFVEEFRNGEGAGGKFRDVLEGIWAKAKDAFGYVRDTVVPALVDLVGWLIRNKDIVIAVGAAVLGYKGYMMALHVWTKAVTIATTIWTGVQKALNVVMKMNPIGLLIAAIAALVAVVILAYRENETFRAIVDRVWAGIKSAIDATVRWFKDTAWPWMRDALGNIRDRFVSTKDRVVGAWDALKSGISTGWDAIKGIFDRFKAGLDSLRDKFASVKDGITRVWGTIGAAIAKPINTVIDTVNRFLENLRSNLNKIPGVNLSGTWGKIPHVPVPAGATSAGSTAGSGRGGRGAIRLAAGGTVPGWSPNDKADNIPAMLTAGEYVLPVGATRSLMSRFGPGFLEQLRRGLPGYASGGPVVGGRNNPQSRTGGFLADGWEWLVDVVKNAAGWVKRTIADILPDMGGSWAAMAAKGAIGTVPEKLGAWIEDNIFGGGAAGAGAGRVNYGGGFGQHPTGMPWQQIWALVKSVVPNAIMTSNYRGGAMTASGIPSLHGMGRAVDWVTPGMVGMNQAFRKVGALMKWSQHFYTPAGPGSQQGFVDAIIARTHRDHAHTALASGGLVKPFVADSGVTLGRGLNLLDNRTGGPEPLGRLDKPIRLDDYTISRLAVAFQDGAGAAVGGHQSRLDYLARSG